MESGLVFLLVVGGWGGDGWLTFPHHVADVPLLFVPTMMISCLKYCDTLLMGHQSEFSSI